MDDRQNSDFQRDDSPIPDNILRPDGGQQSDSPQRDDSPRAGRGQPSAPGPQHGDAPYSEPACSAGSGAAAPQTAKHGGGCLKWILIILGALALISIFRGCVRDAHQKPIRSTVTAAPAAEPTPTPAAYVQSTYLTELDALRCDNVDIENRYDIEANTGDAYGHALSGESPYSEVIYNLSGNYDQLDGVWFICSNYKNTDNDQGLKIYADNVCVYTAPAITRGSLPVNVSVDITSCNLLTIRFTKGSYAGVLGDVVLSNKTDRTPNPEPYQPSVLPVWLTSLDSLTEDQVRASGGTAYANTGEVFAHCITMSSIPFGEKVGSMEYYLAGKYAALSGVLCVSEDCKNIDTASYFEIYADGELVYTSPEMTQGSLPESFQVDIQHCQKLKIVLYGYNSFLGNLRLDP